ncbi:MAG: flagellar biosynthesis regulator FlaF [Paracoccaceae bacterium]
MTPHQTATAAYAPDAAPLRSARGTEFEIFARVTRRLTSAAKDGAFPALAAALHDNRRLWTALAADLADEGNALPPGLRAQLFYLAEFTMAHSARVLSGEATAEALVDINTSVMKGLAGPGAAA